MSFTRIFQTNRLGAFFIAVGGLISTSALAAEPASASKALEVRRLVGTNTVDFDRDVVPALRANCLPCHNKSTTKGDLLLESPADMIKGGETGPALQPGKAAESLLFKLASHTAKPRMPPRENKVNAVELTPQQLGLLAAWIDQGARPSPYREEVIAWQSLAPEIRPIFALAAATDGSGIAASHGNRIDLYSLPNLERIAQAVDPSLTSPGGIGIAHRDQVNALAMSPNGEWLASGGFREVKVWRRSVPVARLPGRPTNLAPSTAGSITSPDGSYLFTLTNGVALLSDARRERFITALHRDRTSIGRSLATEQAVTWIRGERDSFQEANEAARKELDSVRARHRKAVDTNAAADHAVSEKQTALEKSRQDRLTAEADQKAADAAGDATPDLAARKKSALELAQKTAKEVEKLESELKVLQQKQASAKYELELALPAVEKVESTLKSGEERKIVLDVELGAAERANQAAIAALTRPSSPRSPGYSPPIAGGWRCCRRMAESISGDRKGAIRAKPFPSHNLCVVSHFSIRSLCWSRRRTMGGSPSASRPPGHSMGFWAPFRLRPSLLIASQHSLFLRRAPSRHRWRRAHPWRRYQYLGRHRRRSDESLHELA